MKRTGRSIVRVTVVLLLAGVLAGCAESWRTTTYDSRLACESFSGSYRESDGTCRHGSH